MVLKYERIVIQQSIDHAAGERNDNKRYTMDLNKIKFISMFHIIFAHNEMKIF